MLCMMNDEKSTKIKKQNQITLGRSRVIGLNFVVKLSAKRIACNGTRTSSS